jgi:hypothetical protein
MSRDHQPEAASVRWARLPFAGRTLGVSSPRIDLADVSKAPEAATWQ